MLTIHLYIAEDEQEVLWSQQETLTQEPVASTSSLTAAILVTHVLQAKQANLMNVEAYVPPQK